MLKKLIAPVVLSGALLGSLAVGGVAYATAPTSGSTVTAGTTPVTHHADAGHGQLRAWLKAHRAAIRAEVVAVSASTIGVTPQALVAELKTGKSIAGVATEHHVDPSAVVTALSVAADAKVAQAVAQHELTRAQGDRIVTILPARIARIVERVR